MEKGVLPASFLSLLDPSTLCKEAAAEFLVRSYFRLFVCLFVLNVHIAFSDSLTLANPAL